jgi:hypothetical protein
MILGPAGSKKLFHWPDGDWRFLSPKAAPFKQDSLIFVGCIDFPPCRDEIDHPVKV